MNKMLASAFWTRSGLSHMVPRLIWFTLFGLAAVAALASVRLIKGWHVVDRPLPSAKATAIPSDDAPALPKGDRLPSPFFDNAPREKPVATVKVDPIEAPRKIEAPKKVESSSGDIVSWHWHQGSKIVRRRRAE